MTIYEKIKPTYLYIKQHSITGLKYFGKTEQKDPYKYTGSGTYWTTHFKKYGKEHIKTLWVSDLYYDTSIIKHALQFSYENNIVESDDWANLIIEDGVGWGSGRYKKEDILTTTTTIEIDEESIKFSLNNISNLIKEKRKLLKLSKIKFSSILGISRTTYEKIENGLSENVSIYIIIKALIALDIKMSF